MNFRNFIVPVVFFSLLIGGCDELGSKSEYGNLQTVEFNNRQHLIAEVELQTFGKYTVAGFRADNGKNNVWVLLNVQYDPYYKQVPQDSFSLTAIELEKIRGVANVSSTVIAVLETRIRDK